MCSNPEGDAIRAVDCLLKAAEIKTAIVKLGNECMDAWVNDNGIRLQGLGPFQAGSPEGRLDAILDELKARTLQNERRIYLHSVDDGVFDHTIPTAEAAKILPASGGRRGIRGIVK